MRYCGTSTGAETCTLTRSVIWRSRQGRWEATHIRQTYHVVVLPSQVRSIPRIPNTARDRASAFFSEIRSLNIVVSSTKGNGRRVFRRPFESKRFSKVRLPSIACWDRGCNGWDVGPWLVSDEIDEELRRCQDFVGEIGFGENPAYEWKLMVGNLVTYSSWYCPREASRY